MSDESTALSLLGGIEFDDPRLYSLLDSFIRDLYALDRQINPPTTRSFGASGIQLPILSAIGGFSGQIFPNNIRLSWTSIGSGIVYEIRYLAGSGYDSDDWDAANSLIETTTAVVNLDPISIPLTTGSHTFFLKGTSSDGIESETAETIIIAIPQITAPVITPTVIDNFVLLRWTIPTSSLAISHYNVYKDGTLIGEMNGTFEAIFETTGGTYTYTVEAEDIVGNVGRSTSVVVSVNQPPDFELQDVRTSDLSGTLVNAIIEDDKIIACLDVTETFEDQD